MKMKKPDEKFLDERKQKQPLKTSDDPMNTFLVSMVTFKVLPVYTSRLNKRHFRIFRGTLYKLTPTTPPKRYSLLLSDWLL